MCRECEETEPVACYLSPEWGGIHVAEWLERSINVFVLALGFVLMVKYRDRGILKRIGESKHRFRTWLTGKG